MLANPKQIANLETLIQCHSAHHSILDTTHSVGVDTDGVLLYGKDMKLHDDSMNQPHKIYGIEATMDTLDAQSQCRFDRLAAGFNLPTNFENKLHSSRLPLRRQSLEKSIGPSHNVLTRATSTIDTAYKKVEKIACLGSGFVGGLG